MGNTIVKKSKRIAVVGLSTFSALFAAFVLVPGLLSTGSDKTIPLEQVINPATYPEVWDSAVSSDYLVNPDIESLSNASEAVVSGTVTDVRYTSSGINAWTIADVSVDEMHTSSELSIHKGDIISIFIQGGYIPLSKRVEAEEKAGSDGIDSQYSDKEMQEVVEYQTVDNMAPINQGKTYLFFLSSTTNPEWAGGYESPMNMESIYRKTKTGQYEVNDVEGNTIDSLSPDRLREVVDKHFIVNGQREELL